MPVTVATLKAVLTVDATNFESGMKKSEKSLHDFADKGKKESKSLHDRMLKDLDSIAAGVKASISAIATSFVTDGVRRIVKSASELTDAMAKVDTIFGKSAESVKEWSENTDEALGLSRKAALDTVGTIGQLYQNMGIAEKASAQMSTKLVALAVDLAALNNIGTEEAMERIKRGVRGSAEALDELGLSFNANMVKQKAYTLGIAKQGETLTEASKAQAIYALMMEQGAKVQGQFARESDTLAAQTKKLQAELENLAADIGQDLVPVAKELVEWFRDLIPDLKEFGKWAVDIAKNLPAVTTEFTNLIDPLGIVAGIADRAAKSFKMLGETVQLVMRTVAQDANALGKMQQFLQDAAELQSAAVDLRSKDKNGFTFIPVGTSNAARRYGDMPAVATNEQYAVIFERAARRAREMGNAAMQTAQAQRASDWYAQAWIDAFGLAPAGTGLPDLGTPPTTPQKPGGGKTKHRRGRSTFTPPGLDPQLTIGAFLPFGDFSELVERGRKMYLEYLAFVEDRGKKAAENLGDFATNAATKTTQSITNLFRKMDESVQKRLTSATTKTSEAMSVATAALTSTVTTMWETATKKAEEEAEHQRKIAEDLKAAIASVLRKRTSDQQSEPDRGMVAAAEGQEVINGIIRSARRASRNFLKALLGDSRDRRNVLKSLVDDLTNTLLDQIGKVSLEKTLLPAIKSMTEKLGEGMAQVVGGVLKGVETSVGRMLGSVYQLLQAMNRKGGLNFGSVLGGIAAGVFLGPASIPFGLNVGGQLWQGDFGGAARDTAIEWASGGFNKSGGGWDYGGNQPVPGPKEWAGNSRAQSTIIQNINIGNQNLYREADEKRVAAENARRIVNTVRGGIPLRV